jgi:hypothetical protein
LTVFLAAAHQALAGASPHEAMRSLLDATVVSLHARSRKWIEHDEDEKAAGLYAAADRLSHRAIAAIHYPPHEHRMPAMIGLTRDWRRASRIGATARRWCRQRGMTTRRPAWPPCRPT